MKQGKTKKILLGILALVVAVAALIAIFMVFKPGSTKGSKTVTIAVIDNEGSETDYTVNTDAEYLKQAMDEAEGLTYEGTDSEYGVMITTVNGIQAVYETNNAYWAFYVNGDYCNYGIEEQPVNDKDTFKIEYTVAQ